MKTFAIYSYQTTFFVIANNGVTAIAMARLSKWYNSFDPIGKANVVYPTLSEAIADNMGQEFTVIGIEK